MIIDDMEKLESPFVREMIDGNFVVVDKIAEGYEWVFEDETVKAIEKIHGENVSIYKENGIITAIWSRNRRIQFFNTENRTIIDGLLNSFEKGYMEFLPDGQSFGELIGPGSQGNPYKILKPLWIPFKTYSKKNLSYLSWGKYPKDFKSISEWFKTLMPLYAGHVGSESKFVEGVVFTHEDGRMAKLRIDMFQFYYEDKNNKPHKHKGEKK